MLNCRVCSSTHLTEGCHWLFKALNNRTSNVEFCKKNTNIWIYQVIFSHESKTNIQYIWCSDICIFEDLSNYFYQLWYFFYILFVWEQRFSYFVSANLLPSLDCLGLQWIQQELLICFRYFFLSCNFLSNCV